MTPAGKALLEPRTKAGWDWLDWIDDSIQPQFVHAGDYQKWRATLTKGILAIEAEAAAPLRAALERLIANLGDRKERRRAAADAIQLLAANPPAATEERDDD